MTGSVSAVHHTSGLNGLSQLSNTVTVDPSRRSANNRFRSSSGVSAGETKAGSRPVARYAGRLARRVLPLAIFGALIAVIGADRMAYRTTGVMRSARATDRSASLINGNPFRMLRNRSSANNASSRFGESGIAGNVV